MTPLHRSQDRSALAAEPLNFKRFRVVLDAHLRVRIAAPLAVLSYNPATLQRGMGERSNSPLVQLVRTRRIELAPLAHVCRKARRTISTSDSVAMTAGLHGDYVRDKEKDCKDSIERNCRFIEMN